MKNKKENKLNASLIICFLRDRFLLVLLVLGGVIYLTVSGNWKFYGEQWDRAVALFRKPEPISEEEARLKKDSQNFWMSLDLSDYESEYLADSMMSQEEPLINVGLLEAAGVVYEEGQGGTLIPEVPSTGGSFQGEVLVTPPPITEAPAVETTPAPTEEPAFRDPSQVVYARVEDSYFSDALFIGDSRTVGLREYGDIADIATFYAETGLSVHKLFTKKIVEVPEQKEKLTVEEALQNNTFEKIYLMIGINEMGTGTVDSFIAKYKEAVEHLRQLQPDAIIYLQAIMKVSEKRSSQGDYIHNEGIDLRNAEIAKLADNVHIYYLDINESISDETGAMNAEYTHDGVHLKAQYIELWKNYLKEHAVSME